MIESAAPVPEPVVASPEPRPEPEPQAVEVPIAEPETVAPPTLTSERPAPSGGMALRAAWTLTGVVLLAALWFAYSARESVMHVWPPSIRAYAALGLAAKR